MTQRLCSAILILEAIVLALTTPVLIGVADVTKGRALSIGLGGCVACLVVSGLLRLAWAYVLGWLIQVAAIALGFEIGEMFLLGLAFLALWGTAYWLGRKIERERAEWEATGVNPRSR